MATKAKPSVKKGKAGKTARRAAPRRVPATPAGYERIIPHLNVRGAEQAIDFYKKAFGARESMRLTAADGKIMHAELKMFGQIVMLGEEAPEMGRPAPDKPSPVSLFAYAPDVDRTIARATAAGARVTMAPQDMFWGDRYGTLSDPFGHSWGFATHKEDVSPRETQKRWQAMLAQQQK